MLQDDALVLHSKVDLLQVDVIRFDYKLWMVPRQRVRRIWNKSAMNISLTEFLKEKNAARR